MDINVAEYADQILVKAIKEIIIQQNPIIETDVQQNDAQQSSANLSAPNSSSKAESAVIIVNKSTMNMHQMINCAYPEVLQICKICLDLGSCSLQLHP